MIIEIARKAVIPFFIPSSFVLRSARRNCAPPRFEQERPQFVAFRKHSAPVAMQTASLGRAYLVLGMERRYARPSHPGKAFDGAREG
jgi:hypothetical protein